MQLPKLTPLQSRFAASLAACCILAIIYFSLYNPHFAYAAELEFAGNGQSRVGEDHNWERLGLSFDEGLRDEGDYTEEDELLSVEIGLDSDKVPKYQEILVKRAETTTQLQGSNIPGNLNINAGESQIWVFQNASLWAPYAPPVRGFPSSLSQAFQNAPDVDVIQQVYAPDGQAPERRDAYMSPRQSESQRVIYVSINTCLQPTWNGTSTKTGPPPQLTLYVSSSDQDPGPDASGDTQQILALDHGFANFSMNVSSSVYLAVSAPSLPTGFTGGWNYELAVSIDDYYHMANTELPFLYLVDSDSQSALLVTDNLTLANADSPVYKEWVNITTVPFILFAQNTNDSSIDGLQNSFCGLQNAPAQIMANVQDSEGVIDDVQMDMITRGLGNKPKEQFFVRNLNGSSEYHGFLAMQGNSTASGSGVVGGGGQVWKSMNFTTKSDGNCQIMYNLDFCSEVAYAVPSNPRTYPSLDQLAALYDNYAAQLYQNFSYSLQLIPCNTTATAQYSLAKNCTDCAAAYKEWVCAVTMPRCEDFTSQLSWLQPRNMGQSFIGNDSMLPDMLLQQPYNPMLGAPGGSVAQQQSYISAMASNSSRNPTIIDEMIMPGPYKELLPCSDLCYSLVNSCPAALGFGCPYRGRGLEASYGERSTNGTLTCSYLGAVYYLNAGDRLTMHNLAMALGMLLSLCMAYIAW